jgi:elongation factor Ts
MTKITAAEVNNLRKHTGAGMMDCKNALVECEGAFDKAVDYLRKKGQKVASKRADRDATEGVVIAKVTEDQSYGAVIMINCETDFVAKNKDFINFVNSIVDLTISNQPKSIDELKELELNGRKVADAIIDQTGIIGEKIELGEFKFVEATKAYAYNHQGNRLASVLGVNKADVAEIDQLGKELTMQVAAMAPIAVDETGVDAEIIAKEKQIGMDQAREEGKPEAILEKIALGKVNKFLRENTLLNQDFIRNTKKSVKQYLSETDKDLKVTSFARVMLASK